MTFIRSGAIYAAANIASAAVPFLLLPLLTRLLSPAEYGEVVAFALLLTLCQAIAGLNVHAALGVAWFKRSREEMPALSGTALAIAIASAFCVAAVAVIALRAIPELSAGLDPMWGAVAALTAGANVILQARLVLWQSQQRALASSALQIAASVVNVSLSLVAVILLGLGSAGRNGAIGVSAMCMSLIAVSFFWWFKELQWAPAREHFLTLARFGVPLVVHTFAAVLLSSADRWAVSLKLGAEQLGIYGAAAQLGMVMGVSADAFVKAYGPWLYAKLSSEDVEDRRIATGAIFAATPGFFIAAFVIGVLLVAVSSFILGSKYKDAASLVPWFMLGGAFTGTYMSTSSLYFFEGRTGLLSLVTLSSGLIGAFATWWLVGLFGLQGAAIGFAVTQGILALTVSGVAMASFALPWREPGAAIAAWWKMCAASRGDRPGADANVNRKR